MSLLTQNRAQQEAELSRNTSVALDRNPDTEEQLEAQIIGIADMGIVKSDYQGEIKFNHQLQILYAVEGFAKTVDTGEVYEDKDGNKTPIDYIERLNFSLFENGAFVKNFLNGLNETYTDKDTLAKFLGKKCRLIFKGKEAKNGKVYTNIDSRLTKNAKGLDVSNRFVPKYWISDKEGNVPQTLAMSINPADSTPKTEVRYKAWQIMSVDKAGRFWTLPDITDIDARIEAMTESANVEYIVDEANGVKRGLNPLYQKRDDKAPAETAPVADAPAESAPVVENAPTSAWD